jgi:hypothetical protein
MRIADSIQLSPKSLCSDERLSQPPAAVLVRLPLAAHSGAERILSPDLRLAIGCAATHIVWPIVSRHILLSWSSSDAGGFHCVQRGQSGRRRLQIQIVPKKGRTTPVSGLSWPETVRPVCAKSGPTPRLVCQWIASIGLDPSFFEAHLLRRTKATLIYCRTGNHGRCSFYWGTRRLGAQCATSALTSMTLSP